MPRKKRTILRAENIKEMDQERQRTLVVFRTVLAETLKDMVNILHLLRPFYPDEEFHLELLSACGFTGMLTLTMEDYGDCPVDEDVAEALKLTTMALLQETKGAIMHRMEGATSLEEVEDELVRRIKKRKNRNSTRRQEQLKAIEERISKRDKKPPSDMDLSEIEAMLDEVVNSTKKPAIPKPPKLPDPKEDYGFLG